MYSNTAIKWEGISHAMYVFLVNSNLKEMYVIMLLLNGMAFHMLYVLLIVVKSQLHFKI